MQPAAAGDDEPGGADVLGAERLGEAATSRSSGRIDDAVSMIAAIRATPMIRNAAGTTIAKPQATTPVAVSATDGRPWGTKAFTSGVPRHSQPTRTPASDQEDAADGGPGDGEPVAAGELRCAGKDLHVRHRRRHARPRRVTTWCYGAQTTVRSTAPDPTGPPIGGARAHRNRSSGP